MKQELIDRMVQQIRFVAANGCEWAKDIVAELDKPDYLIIAREICARSSDTCDKLYRIGAFDAHPSVRYALEQLERAAALRT